MRDFGIDPQYYDPAPYARLIQIVVLNIVLFFIFLQRDLSALGPFSLMGFISVIYTIMLVAFQSPKFHDKHCEGQSFKTMHWSWATIQAFCVTMFAFMCHTTIF